jgi:hypothetical protein
MVASPPIHRAAASLGQMKGELMAAIGIRSLVITLLLSVGLVAPHARADVIYSFNQTSLSGTCAFDVPCVPSVPPPVPIVSLTIEVTDSAAANGFSVSQSNTFSPAVSPQPPLDLTGTGVVRIAFGGVGFATFQSGPSCNSFAAGGCGSPDITPGWEIGLVGGPGGVGGTISYFGENDDFTFSLSPAPAITTGTWVTDAGANGCFYDPGCSFSGVMTVSAVPEPASLGLLTFGVAGLLALCRRRVSRPSRS